jgi:hypothetical protein
VGVPHLVHDDAGVLAERVEARAEEKAKAAEERRLRIDEASEQREAKSTEPKLARRLTRKRSLKSGSRNLSTRAI